MKENQYKIEFYWNTSPIEISNKRYYKPEIIGNISFGIFSDITGNSNQSINAIDLISNDSDNSIVLGSDNKLYSESDSHALKTTNW